MNIDVITYECITNVSGSKTKDGHIYLIFTANEEMMVRAGEMEGDSAQSGATLPAAVAMEEEKEEEEKERAVTPTP